MTAEAAERRPLILAAVWSMALAGFAAVLIAPVARADSLFQAPWFAIVVVAVLYAAFERFTFRVEFRRETMSFSLSEVATVFALAFLVPIVAVVVRTVWSLLTIVLVDRPPTIKIVFNASLFAFEMALAVRVVRGLVGGDPEPGPFLLAAAAGTLAATTLGIFAVWTIISFYEGAFFHRIRTELTSSVAIAAVGATIAVVSVAPALFGFRYAWLGAVPVLCASFILRHHGELNRRHRKLSDLHQFTRVLGRAIDLDLVAPRALEEIARLVRAERVTLRLDEEVGHLVWSHGATIGEDDHLEDDQGFMVPVSTDDTTLGELFIAQPFRDVGAFGPDDVDLASDLAGQLAVSMRNGLLHSTLERAALRDALTGNPNRTAFEQRLRQSLAAPSRPVVAVAILDLNQFKEVNDTLGHHVGDQVLVEFSRRVASELEDDDLLARFGGDEFAILLERDDIAQVRLVVDAILTRSYQPLRLDTCDAVVTASIGVTLTARHETEPSDVLRRGDIAMYAAKHQRIGIEFYREEIDRRTPARLSLLGDLRSALERNDVEVHYQPKIDLETSTVIGAEALVRWTHPERGPVPPDDFIGVAEESGLIRLVTDLVLRKAVDRAKQWSDAGHDLEVSVNLSALDLHDTHLAGRVAEHLERTGLPPGRLILEITESAIMVDSDRTISTIESLDLLGVRLSLDDFGTGYSSLSYLRRLPVGELKIDRGFVSELLVNASDDVIVRSTIDLGHNLGLTVVAEGVENAEVCARLLALGCDVAQGFGIARPLAADQFSEWLLNTTYTVARHEGLAPAE